MTDKWLKQLQQYSIKLTDKELFQIQTYVKLLKEKNKEINLVSNTEINNIMTVHIPDVVSFYLLYKEGILQNRSLKIADIGSGAGLPGLVLSITLPDSEIALIESMQKKAGFLNHCLKVLGITNAYVLQNRVELIAQNPEYREYFQVVTARAVASLPVLLEYALPLLASGGIFVAYKTEKEAENIENINHIAKKLGGVFKVALEYNLQEMQFRRKLIVFEKLEHTDPEYPRRTGIPSKRPLQ